GPFHLLVVLDVDWLPATVRTTDCCIGFPGEVQFRYRFQAGVHDEPHVWVAEVLHGLCSPGLQTSTILTILYAFHDNNTGISGVQLAQLLNDILFESVTRLK